MIFQERRIEYLEQGTFLCAFVLDDNNKRLRIVNQKGRELNLPHSRVMHVDLLRSQVPDGREERVRQLEETALVRSRLAGEISLVDLWEVVREEPGQTLGVEFAAELVFGQPASDDQMAAFVRALFGDKIFFKYKDRRVLVHSEEVVAQLSERLAREEEKSRLLQHGARSLAKLARGEDPGIWPERQRCIALVRDFYLFDKDAEEAALAAQLQREAGLTAPHAVFDLMVAIGVWNRNENIMLLRQGVPVAFAPEVVAEATAITALSTEEMLARGYEDLRHLPLFTVDGPQTRDHDDALHLEKRPDGSFLVGIHIANVAAYVAPGSLLFEEARQRVTSIYLADAQVPMLPPVLSEGLCSLFAGEDRPALSFLVELTKNGEIRGTRVVPSLVRVSRQMTYDEVDGVVDTDETFVALYRLAQLLQRHRVDNDALIMPFPDVQIDIGDDGEVRAITLADSDSPGRMMIAEFMVLANSVAAQYLADCQVPGLFRGQGRPGQRMVREPQHNLFLNLRQRKHLAPGQLVTSPVPHSGVGVPSYTTATSPIRRFLDLVVQHQILAQAAGRNMCFPEAELAGFAGEISRAQSRVNLVRQHRHRYWLLRYFEKRIGQYFDALMLGKGKKRVQVVLTDFLLEGDLAPNQAITARPGEMVRVKIARAVAMDSILRLDW